MDVFPTFLSGADILLLGNSYSQHRMARLTLAWRYICSGCTPEHLHTCILVHMYVCTPVHLQTFILVHIYACTLVHLHQDKLDEHIIGLYTCTHIHLSTWLNRDWRTHTRLLTVNLGSKRMDIKDFGEIYPKIAGHFL